MNKLKQPGYLTERIKFHCTKLELAAWKKASNETAAIPIPLYTWIRHELNGALMELNEYRVTITKTITCPNCQANLHIDSPALPSDKTKTLVEVFKEQDNEETT